MRIRYWIRNFFGFSRNETNGFLILLPLMILILFSNSIYKAIVFRQAEEPKENEYLDSLIANWDFEGKLPFEVQSVQPFEFDPNTASSDELQQLGFPKYLSNRIVTYRSKGGKFKVPHDLLKIYGMDSALFAKVASYVIIPEPVAENATPSKQRKVTTQYHKPSLQPFDLNLADSVQLKSIKGIGPVLASRIIRFRNRLGGFTNDNQLTEVYGLDSTVVKTLKQQTFITTNFQPYRIDINKATEQELVRHPYFSYKLSKTIVAYRFQHGTFKEIDDLLKIDLVDQQVLNKIRPYLKVEP